MRGCSQTCASAFQSRWVFWVVVGMTIAMLGAHTVLTDLGRVLPLLQQNVCLNFHATGDRIGEFSLPGQMAGSRPPLVRRLEWSETVPSIQWFRCTGQDGVCGSCENVNTSVTCPASSTTCSAAEASDSGPAPSESSSPWSIISCCQRDDLCCSKYVSSMEDTNTYNPIASGPPFDVVVAADVVYSVGSFEPLIKVIRCFMARSLYLYINNRFWAWQ